MDNKNIEDWFFAKSPITKEKYKSCKHENIIIPTTTENIGEESFSFSDVKVINFKNLKMLKSIDNNAFSKSKLVNVNLGEARILKKIGENTFSGCHDLEKVVLPPSLTNVGYCAFSDCKNLVSVKFKNYNDNIKISWSTGCFSGCSKLEEIELGKIENFETSFFVNCYLLKKIIFCFPKKYGFGIFHYAFFCCSNLRDFDTSHVSFIMKGSFRKSGIEKADLSGLSPKFCFDELNVECFADTINLEEINLPDWLEKIPDGAFKGSNVKNIKGGNIRMIGKESFMNCPLINIPNWKPYIIGDNAFYGSGIKSMDLSKCLAIGIKSFSRCGLEILNLEKMIDIKRSSFEDCIKLKTINFGSSLETIDSQSFGGCLKLEKITFPPSLKRVYVNSFIGCDTLGKVFFENMETKYHETSFPDTAKIFFLIDNKYLSLDENGFGSLTEPDSFKCPISQDNIDNMVLLSDGRIYEKNYIDNYFKLANIPYYSPVTREEFRILNPMKYFPDHYYIKVYKS